jgi:hypothetical protein
LRFVGNLRLTKASHGFSSLLQSKGNERQTEEVGGAKCVASFGRWKN